MGGSPRRVKRRTIRFEARRREEDRQRTDALAAGVEEVERRGPTRLDAESDPGADELLDFPHLVGDKPPDVGNAGGRKLTDPLGMGGLGQNREGGGERHAFRTP